MGSPWIHHGLKSTLSVTCPEPPSDLFQGKPEELAQNGELTENAAMSLLAIP
jgi:hypothetical protein